MKKKTVPRWLGFDLGGTKMLAAVFDGDFNLLASHKEKTRGLEGSRAVLGRIRQTIESTLAKAGLAPEDLGGIGVGCPGPLDLDRGIVLQAPNLGWKNIPIKNSLEKAFHCPAVIANDVDTGTFGEYRFGAGRGARSVLGIFPGTGIGGGFVTEGRILRGKTGSCMEIGHLRVRPGGRLCGCGQRGCLETVASRLAISAEAAVAVFRGQAPILRDLAGTDLAAIKSGTLAKAVREGDTVVEAIVRHAFRELGAAAAGVTNLLAPDVIVLGGGLVEAMPEIALDEVRRAVAELAMAAFASSLKVAAAELGDNATVMGAAALAADRAGAP